ncbi:MAG: hypothetical protein GY821_05350 [Gammaproteobacteria bacterium]|nr:hypothetical protein [Gammaproteobacteria bacterium]
MQVQQMHALQTVGQQQQSGEWFAAECPSRRTSCGEMVHPGKLQTFDGSSSFPEIVYFGTKRREMMS